MTIREMKKELNRYDENTEIVVSSALNGKKWKLSSIYEGDGKVNISLLLVEDPYSIEEA